jgi:hypothetical protein
MTVRSREGARRISKKPFKSSAIGKKRGALRHRNLKTREDLYHRSGRRARLLDLVDSCSS